ncbi:hypothetical protein [Streptomyces jumonjinensis]|uniref:hypothetical protein n=1 Tax=Streptomyces jumonjinensis TaxID=1945 RepID=UPI00378A2E76
MSGKAVGPHRAERRDPLGTVLTGCWALGQLAALLLLGAIGVHQTDLDVLPVRPATQSEPDRE